jgi:predicted HD phosphohydrolase
VTAEEMKRAHDGICKVINATFEDDERRLISSMISDLGEQLYMSPASDRGDSGYAMAGGLLAYMATALNHARRLAPILAPDESPQSIVKVALFHDIGRVGDPKTHEPYYVPEADSWKREKLGKNYRYNERLPKMTHSSRSLYVLSHYGVPLSMGEWIAIQTAHGYGLEENRFYIGDDCQLVLITQTAVRGALLR